MDSAEFVDLSKTIFTVVGVIVAAFFSYKAVVHSRQTKQTVEHELTENSGTSLLDKINSHLDRQVDSLKEMVRARVGSLERSTNARLDAIDKRIESLDRRETSNYDRIGEVADELRDTKADIDKRLRRP